MDSEAVREKALGAPPVRAEYVADEREFDTMFDRFEVALSLAATGYLADTLKGGPFLFGRLIKRWFQNEDLRDSMFKEITEFTHPLWEWMLNSFGDRDEFAGTVYKIRELAERKGWNMG